MVDLLKKYQIYLYAQKIKIPATYWLLGIFITAILLGAIGFLINFKLGILLFAVILDLGIGIPIYLYDLHINKIEKYWPDALKLIADTMKAGSSFDYAIREVCVADFGPLSYEINEVIRRLEMGNSMSVALDYLSLHIDSKIVRRTVTLIQESLKTGAPLADVLDEIANDTKYMFRIKKERKTKTLLQTIFIIVASSIVAPFIFGLTRVITKFLTDIAANSGIATASALAISLKSQATIFVLLDLYILFEVLAASAIICIMKDGKLSGLFVYFPVLICVAYVVYFIAQFILNQILLGMV
jgi:archaellum biogenesis protein FlaJ (TadC family)